MVRVEDSASMNRNSLWVVGLASLLQFLVMLAIVLSSTFLDQGVSIHITYVSVVGGFTAGILSSGEKEDHTGSATWLLGDAVVNGSLAAVLATSAAFVLQSFANLVTVRLEQGFWAPLIIGVYQGAFFAFHFVSAVFLGALAAIVGHWVGNLTTRPLRDTR